MDDETKARAREKMRALGALGGRATFARHGRAHMSEIGKRGFQRTLTTGNYSDAGHLISHWVEIGKLRKRTKVAGRSDDAGNWTPARWIEHEEG